ncbi:MAG: HD domain-containing protein, partial [Lachnospiraceae bacterium]|nr:HD domain-containing protein [Lachnospiraceae bacterium]
MNQTETLKENFREYTKRMSSIRKLSSPDIRSWDDAERYSDRLLQNFKEIGELAFFNRKMLDEDLYPLLLSNESLDPAVSEELEALADSLITVAGENEDYESLDLPLAAMISERLLKETEKSGDLSARIRKMDEQMDVCYSLMNMTERITTHPEISAAYRKKGLALGEEFQALLDPERFLSIEDPECREIVLTDARFMTAYYERSSDAAEKRRNLKILDRMMEISEDPFYHEAVPEFDWQYFVFRTLEYYLQCTDIGNARGFSPSQLKRISDRAREIEQLCAFNAARFEGVIGRRFVSVNAARCYYLSGDIDRTTYWDTLLDAYADRDPMDFTAEGSYYNVLLPLEIICLLDPGNLSLKEEALLSDLYHELSAYLFHIPNSGSMSFLLEYFSEIIRRFIEVPGGVTFETFVLQCLAAMHPPTYIHSHMVGQIAERLAYHLLKQKPEMFIGFPGCHTVSAVKAHREEILSYVWHAGVCHDFGKVCIIDTIFVYGRKLLDLEFNIIKSHPLIGSQFLKKHASTRKYADVALGHHRWYNDQGGYPADFKTADSPYKTV